MDIWQRGTTFTIASGVPQYTADRWTNYFNAAGTIAQETTIKPATSTNSLKITATANSGDNGIFQLVEQLNMEQFRGNTVVLSVKLAGTATLLPSLSLAYSTTANDTLLNTNTIITASSQTQPTINASTFVTYTSTFAVPTTAKTLRIGIASNTIVNTNVLYVAEVQLELGSTASLFARAGGNIAGELAACQRYYFRTGNLAYQYYGQGPASSTTVAQIAINLPVQMRVEPSSLDFSLLAVTDIAAVFTSVSAISLSAGLNSSPVVGHLTATVASGLTQFRTYRLTNNANAAAYIGFNAEL
jgi:hypothetical protein